MPPPKLRHRDAQTAGCGDPQLRMSVDISSFKLLCPLILQEWTLGVRYKRCLSSTWPAPACGVASS
eukprot:scaffold126996_cov69-Phaeocystis_antarctica.AAC.1